MAAQPTIDENKIVLIIDAAGQEAEKLKQKYRELILLINQARGIQKNKDQMPMSGLTKKELSPQLRQMIYDDILEAANRLGISTT